MHNFFAPTQTVIPTGAQRSGGTRSCFSLRSQNLLIFEWAAMHHNVFARIQTVIPTGAQRSGGTRSCFSLRSQNLLISEWAAMHNFSPQFKLSFRPERSAVEEPAVAFRFVARISQFPSAFPRSSSSPPALSFDTARGRPIHFMPCASAIFASHLEPGANAHKEAGYICADQMSDSFFRLQRGDGPYIPSSRQLWN